MIARLNRLLSPLFFVTSIVFAVFFIFGPSHSLLSRLPLPQASATKLLNYFGLLSFLLFLTTVVLYLWKEIVSHRQSVANPAPHSEVQPRPTRWVLFIQILLSLVLFSQTLSQVNVPLDWDEHEHGFLLGSPNYTRALNPFYGSENHVVASLAGYLSMQAFGFGKLQARIPALLFALGFLIVLNFFAARHLTPLLSLGLFAVLATNQMVVYTLHQMRGYTPLFLFTTWALYLVFETVFSRRSINPVGFATVGVLALFSHTFGGLFLGVLFLTLLIYLYVNRRDIEPSVLTQANRILWIIAGLLIFYAALSVFIILHLEDTGFAMGAAKETPAWLKNLMLYRPFTIFGLVRSWELKLAVLIGVVVLAVGAFHKRSQREWFAWAYVAILFSFFGMVSQLISFTVLEGRMLQPFLLLMLVTLFAAVARVKAQRLRVAIAFGAVICLSLPWFTHNDTADPLPGFFADTESFAHQVKTTTASEKEACFSFSGDEASTSYLRYFYFHADKKWTEGMSCSHFHLFVERGIFDRWSKIDARIAARGNVVFHDGKGRILFRMPNAPLNISARD